MAVCSICFNPFIHRYGFLRPCQLLHGIAILHTHRKLHAPGLKQLRCLLCRVCFSLSLIGVAFYVLIDSFIVMSFNVNNLLKKEAARLKKHPQRHVAPFRVL